MKPKKAAGLIYGAQFHHLDHLGPLCVALEIPLIVTEEEIGRAAQKFYPSLVTHTYDALVAPQKLAKEYEIIFSSLPLDLFEEIFLVAERLQGKTLLSVWVPHGNSDKGYIVPFMEALHKERIALVYGARMCAFLKEKGVFNKIEHILEIGNFRYEYYLKFKPFYDTLIRKSIALYLDPQKKTILYAPTWHDSENSCSLFNAGPTLLEKLQKECNVIVKIHPNTSLMHLAEIEALKGRFEEVLFLEEFSPIYPLLEISDLYIGDMSSIGYDFLVFNRPMIFINHDERAPTPLSSCGITLIHENFSQIGSLIQKDQKELHAIREKLCTETFNPHSSLSKMRSAIFSLCSDILEEGLLF